MTDKESSAEGRLTNRYLVRMTDEDRAELEKRARKHGVTPAELIRQLIRHGAFPPKGIKVQVSDGDYKRYLEQLEAMQNKGPL